MFSILSQAKSGQVVFIVCSGSHTSSTSECCNSNIYQTYYTTPAILYTRKNYSILNFQNIEYCREYLDFYDKLYRTCSGLCPVTQSLTKYSTYQPIRIAPFLGKLLIGQLSSRAAQQTERAALIQQAVQTEHK